MNELNLEQAVLKELKGINKGLNLIANEVKANRELKQSISDQLQELERGLKEIKDDPFGTK